MKRWRAQYKITRFIINLVILSVSAVLLIVLNKNCRYSNTDLNIALSMLLWLTLRFIYLVFIDAELYRYYYGLNKVV